MKYTESPNFNWVKSGKSFKKGRTCTKPCFSLGCACVASPREMRSAHCLTGKPWLLPISSFFLPFEGIECDFFAAPLFLWLHRTTKRPPPKKKRRKKHINQNRHQEGGPGSCSFPRVGFAFEREHLQISTGLVSNKMAPPEKGHGFLLVNQPKQSPKTRTAGVSIRDQPYPRGDSLCLTKKWADEPLPQQPQHPARPS